jgi:hypothetical protein
VRGDRKGESGKGRPDAPDQRGADGDAARGVRGALAEIRGADRINRLLTGAFGAIASEALPAPLKDLVARLLVSPARGQPDGDADRAPDVALS